MEVRNDISSEILLSLSIIGEAQPSSLLFIIIRYDRCSVGWRSISARSKCTKRTSFGVKRIGKKWIDPISTILTLDYLYL